MIIGACGYGATGSSIITDLLREFNGLQIYDDFEFVFTYKVGCLEDLEYNLVKHFSKAASSDAAINRFLRSSHYIYSIHSKTN